MKNRNFSRNPMYPMVPRTTLVTQNSARSDRSALALFEATSGFGVWRTRVRCITTAAMMPTNKSAIQIQICGAVGTVRVGTAPRGQSVAESVPKGCSVKERRAPERQVFRNPVDNRQINQQRCAGQQTHPRHRPNYFPPLPSNCHQGSSGQHCSEKDYVIIDTLGEQQADKTGRKDPRLRRGLHDAPDLTETEH